MPNPAKAASERRIKQLEQTIIKGEAALGRHRPERRLEASCDELDAELDKVRTLLAAAQQEQAGIPGRVPLGEIAPDARLLDSETKLITHTFRIAAYNTESALASIPFS